MFFEILTIFLASQLVFGIILWLRVKDLYKYPNSLGTPIIGNLYYFYKYLMFAKVQNLYETMIKLQENIGKDYYFTILLGQKSFVISCPKLFEEIASNPKISEKPKIVYGMAENYFDGVFTYCGYDSEYKTRSKELNSRMKSNLISGPYHLSFINNSKEVINLIKKDQNNVDIHNLMYFYALNALCETLFNRKKLIPIEHEALSNMMRLGVFASVTFVNSIFSYLLSTAAIYFDKMILRGLTEILYEVLDEELENITKYDAGDKKYLPLSKLIALRNSERDCPKKQIKKEFIELLLVGSHSVAVALAGGLTILATLPEIQEKIWEEQYEIFGNSDRDTTAEDIKKMEYLDRVMNEILRFHGPSMIAKHTTGDITLDGVIIPKGTNIVLLLRPSRMDPHFWKNPKSFDPDHFLNEQDRPKYSNAAFGVGVRGCAGQAYAVQEMKVLISMLSRKFKFSTKRKFEDIDFEFFVLDEIKEFDKLQVEERI